ncbi:MAG: hypothetical protein CBC03_12355 [Pseudoalteromonas sp. TMED43]|nr:MAG: hypothetical protein CBC03_12355 [Pseudoalteromonas sp. TMED43]|tara:strand:- start:238 stop:474 length:237 start_codon:yes stop_codon:yes gene_type:complete
MTHFEYNIQTGEKKEVDTPLPEYTVDAAEMVKTARAISYPSLGDFADAMYWNSKGDDSKLTAYYAACEKVKTDNPKPE